MLTQGAPTHIPGVSLSHNIVMMLEVKGVDILPPSAELEFSDTCKKKKQHPNTLPVPRGAMFVSEDLLRKKNIRGSQATPGGIIYCTFRLYFFSQLLSLAGVPTVVFNII